MGNPVIFNGPYAKVLAANGIKLKGDTLIMEGAIDPSVTDPSAPNGSIYLSSVHGIFQRKNSKWKKIALAEELMTQILKQDFEDVTLTDFTQTGLELVESPFINGKVTARLIHQAASTYSFKQVKEVDPAFRGKNNTIRLNARSTALSANVTVKVIDETNDPTGLAPLLNSTFTTGQITAAVFNTSSASPTVTVTDNAILNSLVIGASITGSGIQTGTVITAKGTGTITISKNAIATATGVSLKVSALPNIQSYSFDIPSNCASISYTISALQEAGLPETYVDDVVVELTQQALQNASITVPKIQVGNASYLGSGLLSVTGNIRFNAANITSNYNGLLSYDQSTGFFTALKNVRVNGSITLEVTTAGSVFDVSVNGVFKQRSNTTPNATVYKSTLAFNIDLLSGQYFNFSSPGTLTNSATDSFTFTFDLLNETETKTIPLTSSVLVTEPDSYLRISGFTPTLGSTATKIVSMTSGTIQQQQGSAFQYLDDTVNGARIVALRDGIFSFTFNADVSSSSSFVTPGLSLNSNSLTTAYPALTAAEKLNVATDTGAAGVAFTATNVYLRANDVVRVHANDNFVGASSAYSVFTVSYQGSTKILNPSSDQKVEIPTHEFAARGASTRGTGAESSTVKFDSIAEISGDGMTVSNTNGTIITFTKKLKVDVDTTVAVAANQVVSVLHNSLNVGSDESGDTSAAYCNVKTTLIAAPGDTLKVVTTVNPTADTTNQFKIVATELSVAVALQNVAPRWDDSDTSLMLSGANGFGTTATTVRRFSSVTNNLGTAISYSDTPDSGAVFTVNESGLYSIKYQDDQSSTSPTSYGISIGNSVTPTSIAYQTFNQIAVVGISSGVIYLTKGQTFVVGSVNPGNVFASSIYTRLYISKVGKTQGTVDVTPFVNMRTHENIVGEVLAYAGTNVPENFLLCDGRAVSRLTYADLFNVIGTSHGSGDGSTTFNIPDYRGRFLRGVDGTAGNDPDKASRTAMNTGGNTGNNVGSVQSDAFQNHKHPSAWWSEATGEGSGAPSNSGYTQTRGAIGAYMNVGGNANNQSAYLRNTYSAVDDGTNGTPRTSSETRGKNAYVNFIIRFKKDQLGVATPTQQVSSDTMNFVFKSTAITDSDPVGTFNTFKKGANSQASTVQCTTAPTQSSASMNVNGVLVTAANYATAGSDALPNRFDIKIGKGLKALEIAGYALTGKATEIILDLFPYSSTELYGITRTYNEVTGVLTLDAGFNNSSSITNRGYLQKVGATGAGTSGYFVFNASQSPSLVSIPNLQQRVAYIQDRKVGTDGGSAVVGWQTRNLNTLDDKSGIVKSLASNGFTLSAGQYKIKAHAPAYQVNSHQIRLRSTGVTWLNGTGEYCLSTDSISNRSFLEGVIDVTTDTQFFIEHYVSQAKATNGLGTLSSSGESYNLFTSVEVTKIK